MLVNEKPALKCWLIYPTKKVYSKKNIPAALLAACTNDISPSAIE
jgi:hypothetical protein